MKTGELLFFHKNGNFPAFKIFYSSYIPQQRKYKIEHHHSECEISLIVSGSCVWCVNDKIYDGKKGDIFLFGINENHYLKEILSTEELLLMNIRFESSSVWTTEIENVDLKYLEIFLHHDNGFSNVISGSSAVATEIAEQMNEIYNECLAKQPEYTLIVKARLTLILAVIGRFYSDTSVQELKLVYNRYGKQLAASVQYIDKNLTEDITLEQIANYAGMSKSYYCTVFKKINGISVWDYITRKRIDMAMQYLRESNMTILEISQRCGYTSISNFNRCFRNKTGISPRTFRKDYPQMI